jgi:hypothetical protein
MTFPERETWYVTVATAKQNNVFAKNQAITGE